MIKGNGRHPVVDQAALDNLHREIETNLHHECEALFNRLRQRVQVAFSALTDPDDLVVSEIYEPGLQQSARLDEKEKDWLSSFTLCCSTDSASLKDVRIAAMDERFDGFNANVVPHHAGAHGQGKQAQVNKGAPLKSPLSQNSSVKNQMPTTGKNKVVLHGSGGGPEFTNRQLGAARGEFEGRSNLWALLQTKEWDSDLAQTPQEAPEEEEPPSGLRGKLKTIINSTMFDVIIGVFILTNSVVMGVSLELEGIGSANAIGIEGDDLESDWPNAREAFRALEHIFTIIYLMELLLRVAGDGCKYLKDLLNWMDIVIVGVSVLELYIIPATGNDFPDMGIIKLMRILRIFRILRMVRILKLFPKLRALVLAVSNSIWSLVWSLLLLGIYIIVAAVFMTQTLQGYLRDDSFDPDERKHVYQFFGNFSRSLVTMFEITLASGTWGRCGRTVIFSVNRMYAAFFLGYMGLVSFAMIRVIAALFLKDTLASSAKDSDIAMADEHRDPNYVKRIWKVFQLMDYDSDGCIQFSELHRMVAEKEVVEELKKLGIVPHELVGLFTLMDDGDDEIAFCEFISGIMRLRNANKGVDLATMLYENKKNIETCACNWKRCRYR